MRGHSQHPKGLFRQYLCQKRTWMRFVAVFAIGYYAWAGLVLAMVGFACATGREAWLVLFLNLKSIWIMIQARRKKFPPDDRHTYYGRHLNL